MPNYNVKLTNPLTDKEFIQGMKEGKFVKRPHHVGLVAFVHYSAVRITEGLNMRKKQFRVKPGILFCDIGHRLKGSRITPPLEIPMDAPFVESIVDSVRATQKDKRVWPYCRKTGYNVVHRVFHYPHYHRLSRITWFFMPHPEIDRPQGFSIPEVQSWTGLSLRALNYYIGLVSISKMGASLRAKRGEN